MPTPQQVLAEITAGPLAAELAPLVTAGNDSGVAAALNRADRACRRPVDIGVLAGFCTGAGITSRVVSIAAVPVGADISVGNPMTMPVKYALNAVVTILVDGYRLTTADLDDPAVGPVLDVLASLGVFTVPVRVAMMALQAASRSRAAELGWPAVTANDVSAAYGRI